MYEPFIVRQAYIINYTLAFLPQMVADPDALHSEWRPVSVFVENGKAGDLTVSEAGRFLRFSGCSPAIWSRDKWRFKEWPQPWAFDRNQWDLEWLPNEELPPESNPSTRLLVHLYPFGMISIGLATAVGFGAGIEIEPLILLLKQMTPAKAGGPAKKPWLRVAAPQEYAGEEVTLDGLADRILAQLRETMFKSLDSAQAVWRSDRADVPFLSGNNGGIVELIRTEPSQFEKGKHAAGFRGIVSLRPSWQDVEADRLLKYREAGSWTGRRSVWHYAGGLNTVLWNDPELGHRRLRRGYPWRVAAISELARAEKVLYEYGREFVAKQAHVPLDRWRPLWRLLGGLPRVMRANDMHVAYDSHARALSTSKAREALRNALAKRGDVEAMEQEDLVRLREVMVDRLDESELRTLCFDLGVEYDDLGGRGRADNARELIAYLHRRRRIYALLDRIRSFRPDIDLEGFDE